jgi:hypothetical protein
MASIDRSHLYFGPDAMAMLTDVTIPVLIVEAEKSALALTAASARTARPLLPIALGGCWNWKGRIGRTTDASGARVDEHGVLPDFDLIDWHDRDVIILFDAQPDGSVVSARRGLAAELLKRGARVRIAELPVEEDVNGPDDYLGAHPDEALFDIIDAAKPAIRWQDAAIADLLREFNLAEPAGELAPDDIAHRLRRLVEALAGAPTLTVALVRDQLKKATRLPSTIISAAFRESPSAPAMTAAAPPATTAGSALVEDDEPWPEPVDGAALLDDTVALIRRHVVMREAQADAAALWAGVAHGADGLDLLPILLLSAPTGDCGKTTAAKVLGRILPRVITVSSLTPAVLYRLVHLYRPTLIADEVDSWLNDERSELRGIFNAAHDREGARIPRCVGDDHHIEVFNVFGPKLLAMIGKPPVTMVSRSIVIQLRRKTADEVVEPFRATRIRNAVEPLRRKWRRWALDNVEALRSNDDPVMPAGFPVNRTSDNWRPLIAVADLAGGDWPGRARRAASEMAQGLRMSDDQSVGITLLHDVRAIFREQGDPDTLSSEEMVTALRTMTERPWADWGRGRGLSVYDLARMLRDFGSEPMGLRSRATRLGERTGRRWHRADFVDAWSRYPAADPEQPKQANDDAPKPADRNSEQDPDVSGSQTPDRPMFVGAVSAVSGSAPDPAEATVEGNWVDV